MDFAALLTRFFGTNDLAAVAPVRLEDGVQALRIGSGTPGGGSC